MTSAGCSENSRPNSMQPGSGRRFSLLAELRSRSALTAAAPRVIWMRFSRQLILCDGPQQLLLIVRDSIRDPAEIFLRRASDVRFLGAGEGNRTLMTSLEGWRSAIELRPRARQGSLDGHRVGTEQRTGCGTLAPNREGSIQTMPRRMVAAADPGSAGR
jgi:hypothetical protein